MKNIGIWLDSEKAHLVTLTDGGETMETILSNVEFFNQKGGAPPRTKWGGPQDVVHEQKYLEREKHQFKAYFNNLANAVKEADALAVFGPADVGEQFRKEMLKSDKSIAAKIKAVTKADSMTDNQVKALVKDFFKTAK